MLMVRLLGFFAAFRKYNMHLRSQVFSGFYSSITVCCFVCALALALASPALGASASKADDDEPGQPYIGRDAQGNRIFGTDDKSEAGFNTDPETGDRTFRTAPPKKQQQDDNWNGPQNIWVTPEIRPGHPGGGRPR